MYDRKLMDALGAFLSNPARDRLDRFLAEAGPFVLIQARRWTDRKMTLAERCREILTEIFLILIEDFLPERVSQPASVLSYLTLRLRRLTRPKTGKVIPFGLAGDLPETGRCGFTLFRLDLTGAIVRVIRENLANEAHPDTRDLEFLFLHVSPDLAWASRFLAVQTGSEERRRMEADKKRHQGFNRALRARFEEISIGDWKDILQWSPGERSHLAWRIIDFSPEEAGYLEENDLDALSSWRETPEEQPGTAPDRLSLIRRGCRAIENLYRKKPSSLFEETALYGLPDETDLLSQILCPGSAAVPAGVAESAAGWESASASGERSGDSGFESEAYSAAVAEFQKWFEGFGNDRENLLFKRVSPRDLVEKKGYQGKKPSSRRIASDRPPSPERDR